MMGEAERIPMDFTWTTCHTTWHEALVIYVVFFGVCALIFALIKWGCSRQTQNVLMVTGGLTVIGTVLNVGIVLSYALLGRAVLVSNSTIASQAMFWHGLAEQARFSTFALVAALCYFMMAWIIGMRKGFKEQE